MSSWQFFVFTFAIAGIGLRKTASPAVPERSSVWDGQRKQLFDLENRLASIRASNVKKATVRRGNHTSKGRRHIGVCVIGQLGRLELESKLKHVLCGQNQTLTSIDVVFVLSPGRIRYVNSHTDFGGHAAWTRQSLNASMATKRCPSMERGTLIIDDAPQESLPFIHAEYVLASNKFPRDMPKKVKRARAHVRQWRAMYACHQHFVQNEQINNKAYDAFVKMRDDSFFPSPWAIDTDLWRDRVLVKECNSWRGLNDKVAWLDAKYGYEFFARPLLDWYFDYNGLKNLKRSNPESYLSAVLRKHEVMVKQVHADIIPAITSRPTASGSACVVLSLVKAGRNGECVPTSCAVRRHLYCTRRCPSSSSPLPENANLGSHAFLCKDQMTCTS